MVKHVRSTMIVPVAKSLSKPSYLLGANWSEVVVVVVSGSVFQVSVITYFYFTAMYVATNCYNLQLQYIYLSILQLHTLTLHKALHWPGA